MKTRTQLLMDTLDRDMWSSKETELLVEISRLEALKQYELLNKTIIEFKSRFVTKTEDWLDYGLYL